MLYLDHRIHVAEQVYHLASIDLWSARCSKLRHNCRAQAR